MFDRTKLVDEGMTAALDDLPVSACPYEDSSVERAMWIEGWLCATDDGSPEHTEASQSPRL